MELTTIIHESVKVALLEDLQGQKDITAMLIPEQKTAQASVITREDMVLCGTAWVEEVFRQLNSELQITWNHRDGEGIAANNTIFTIKGDARSILTGERTALNFLQTLSGVATITRKYVDSLASTKTKLLDTRKTVPGMRMAQKYAVTCGGGHNHRIGLFDAFLIKENHILACGSIAKAVNAARKIAKDKKVEVEVENLTELQEAISAQADIAMLDNFTLDLIKEAVTINNNRLKLEVSGDVNLQNIGKIGETGVDYVSVGSLTKHLCAINLSMRFKAD